MATQSKVDIEAIRAHGEAMKGCDCGSPRVDLVEIENRLLTKGHIGTMDTRALMAEIRRLQSVTVWGHCEWCNLYVHAIRRPGGILNVTEDEAGDIPHICASGDLTKEMVALRSRVRSLEEDAKRLDWLERFPVVGSMRVRFEVQEGHTWREAIDFDIRESAREAIDVARSPILESAE